ncbi:MAG: cache domain-containing protein [Planctomycetes bacterium]|nr:cache domain-containing protein [Planctomycetota bacterium]
MRRPTLVLATLCCALSTWSPLAAAEADLAELAKVATAKCEATAKDKPTPQLIVAKVKEAAALIEKEGEAAFPKLRGDSPFIFGGTYVWVHDLDTNVMYMHPIKPKMEGKPQAGISDVKGKPIFIEMGRIINEQGGAGWVDYVWPKPGQKEGSIKVSYVKLAKHGGKNYVVGCGAYDITLEEIEKSGAK